MPTRRRKIARSAVRRVKRRDTHRNAKLRSLRYRKRAHTNSTVKKNQQGGEWSFKQPEWFMTSREQVIAQSIQLRKDKKEEEEKYWADLKLKQDAKAPLIAARKKEEEAAAWSHEYLTLRINNDVQI